MYEVAKQYDYAFRCIADLRRERWHAETSHVSLQASIPGVPP